MSTVAWDGYEILAGSQFISKKYQAFEESGIHRLRRDDFSSFARVGQSEGEGDRAAKASISAAFDEAQDSTLCRLSFETLAIDPERPNSPPHFIRSWRPKSSD